MKKRLIGIVCVLLLVYALSDGGIAMADSLITPEALIKASGISGDEIDSADLKEVIRRFCITEESVAAMTEAELAEALDIVIHTDYRNNYLYLFELTGYEPNLSELKAEDIRRVAVFSRIEVIRETALADFEAGAVYADTASFFLPDIQQAEEKRTMDEKTRAELLELILRFPWEDAAAVCVPPRYEVSASYGIAIETSDGVAHFAFDGGDDNLGWEVVHELIVRCVGDAYYSFE